MKSIKLPFTEDRRSVVKGNLITTISVRPQEGQICRLCEYEIEDPSVDTWLLILVAQEGDLTDLAAEWFCEGCSDEQLVRMNRRKEQEEHSAKNTQKD